ncbi:radical SAM protein [bacterium]|nr:radical SAM protein [bacterium]
MNKTTDKYLYQTDKKEINFRMWMAFAGIESFAMSSLGYLYMFKTIDELDFVDVERIASDTEKTKYCVNQLNLIGFSFSFDLDFLTIFQMFDKYKIPYKAEERDENYPLIFAGGPVVSCNPEPYSAFFDFFIIGDGEDINVKIIHIINENKDKSKNELLELLAKVDGIYVPALKNNVKKLTKSPLDCIYTPILSDRAYFKNTFIIEVERGCANCCGFCLASYLNLPVRFINNDELLKTVELGLKNTNKIALLGAQISAHPNFENICEYIYSRIQNGENIEMTLSSLRVDAVNEKIIKTLAASGQKTSTLAIEAGSERLRKIINKNITEEQILKAVKIARENGLKGLKFYGMLGLPTETKDDLDELVRLAKRIKSENKGFEINFGFSTFVPKPHTPFQWFGRESTKNLEKKAQYIKKELHKIGIKASVSSAKWDYWQAVISRGDSTICDFLIDVYKNGGKLGAFSSAAKKYKINTDYYALENYDFEKILPWDFIKIHPGKEHLIKENQRLLNSTVYIGV